MKLVLVTTLFFVFCFTLQAQENPVFTITGGYMYLNADQHAATRASFSGWYVIPEYHVTKSWSVIAEATGFTGSPVGKSTNVHSYTAGPVYAIDTKTRITPFFFGEVGDARTSQAGSVNHAFALVAGLGANVKLVKRVSLQLIPGEYILTTPAHGALHNYGAHVGLAFDFGSK